MYILTIIRFAVIKTGLHHTAAAVVELCPKIFEISFSELTASGRKT